MYGNMLVSFHLHICGLDLMMTDEVVATQFHRAATDRGKHQLQLK
jgi:hypothetical protein